MITVLIRAFSRSLPQNIMGRRELLPLRSRTQQQDKQNKPNGKILDAWKNSDFDTFVRNLDKSVFSHTYSEHNNLRLLDLIVSGKPFKNKFLEEALKAKPEINKFNTKVRYVAIHFAVGSGNFEAFWCLQKAGADLNIQDRDGDTILHYVVQHYGEDQEGFRKFLPELLKLETIAVNVPNLNGVTPVALAAEKDCQELVQEFLKLGPAIDLDTFKDRDGITAREKILNKFPNFGETLPQKWQPHSDGRIIDYQYRLFYFLPGSSYQQEKLLKETFEEALKAVNFEKYGLFECIDPKGLTLFQNAVQQPKNIAMRLFLKGGADVNYAPDGTDRPIFIAARNKNLTCFSDLISNKNVEILPNARKDTLLHVLARHRGSSFTYSDALRKLFLDKRIKINDKNINGHTALHVAVTHANEDTIFRLLDNGARLDIANNLGETPLAHLRPDTYGNYLNSKITVKKEVAAQDLKYTILFDYKFISSTSGTAHVQDISVKPLETLLKSKEHRKFLAHPIIAAILFFKWKKIRWLFYSYLLLSTLFCALFTTFLYLGPRISCLSNSSENPGLYGNFILSVEVFLWIYLILRGLWEMIDLFFSRLQYVKSIENYLQFAMIACSIVCLSYDCPKNSEIWQHCQGVSAFAVLFAWIELFFIIGKHPKTNSFIGMFRKASWFLLQFLAVHTALILAFVFSFYIMFQNEPGAFESIPKAFFKTLVMVSGEYEVNDIPFDSVPIVSHILFILFLFLVAIVLFNLLIGLAVSATRPIEEDSFLYGCIAQVPIVSLIETTFFNNLQYLKTKICRKVNSPQLQLYPILAIRPNKKNKQMKVIVKKENSDSLTIEGIIKFKKDSIIHVQHVLSKRIIEDAQTILAKGDPFVIEQKIENLQNQLEEIKNILGKLTNRTDNA